MKNPLSSLINLLLSLNHIFIDNDELNFQIESHPSYPSLHAITGVLDHFNIDNVALDVPVNETTLSQLPKTFLAQLKTEHGETFAIATNKGLNYEVLFSKKEKKTLSIKTFLKDFTGIIVAVEKTEDMLTTKYANNSVFSVLSIFTFVLIGVLLFSSGIDFVSSVMLLMALLGAYVSHTLVKQNLGESTALGDTFCHSTNTLTSCNKVLTSKGAQFGNFKLSDLSMSYFTGFIISAFVLIITTGDITPLYLISILALPITIYSIYYQYAIVKQWCVLCLSIVGLLWIQAIFSFFNSNVIITFISDINLDEILITAISFLSVFVLWNIFSSRSKLLKELKGSKLKYFKFKRDFSLFNLSLNTSKTIDTNIPEISEIVFGNKISNLNITIITSPFCGHCKSVHTLVKDILKNYSELVKLNIRFNTNNSNTLLIDVTSRLLELYHTQGEAKCFEAMHDIYGDLNTKAWISKWGITTNKSIYQQILENQYQWCISNDINFTPEILINGKSYPKVYDRADLIFFIEELYENTNKSMIGPSMLQSTI